MDRDEERQHVANARSGDQAAAAALIRRHQRSLFAYILRMSGRHELAEDVVQEAFVRALTHLDRFDDRYRFSTWLFTIARRVYLNQVQKMHPRSDTDLVHTEARPDGGDPGPHGFVEHRDTGRAAADMLQAAMGRLTPEQREILILFHQQEWPISLISEQLGMPEGTVKSHLHRGRRKLRDFLLETPGSARTLRQVCPDLAAPSEATQPRLRIAGEGVA